MTATEVFANQPSTTATGSTGSTAPASGTTETWTVQSSASFPSASTGTTQFHVADAASGKGGEIIAVTNVSGTTWTVTRGAESTTPVSHATGFTITQIVTAGWLNSVGTGGGGVASVTFTYGSSGAVPSSGTYTAGAVVIDQNNILRVCTASGTPGTWARAGAQPHQFWVDDYGALGNGTQALVTTVSGSATINTTALSAPSAPALSNSGTGGSLTAGTYQVKVTYVNRWGETVASSSASIAISGAQPLTISTPAGSGNATGYYAYVTQAGGATYTRQQTAGSPTQLGTSLVLTANPTSSGANPPGADTSAAAVFSSGDAGKNIMIQGALTATNNGAGVGTIATYVSPTSVTLDSAWPTANTAGCAMVFCSDDRAAIDNCITAAYNYAITHDFFCQVIASNKIYGLGSGFFQTAYAGVGLDNSTGNPQGQFTYNTQVRIPGHNGSGQTPKLEFQLTGPGDNAHNEFWASALPNCNGATFVSFSYGPTTASTIYGQQSAIGGPAAGVSVASDGFCNVHAVVKGVRVYQPGYSNSIGIDLATMGGCRVNGFSGAYAPSTSQGGGVNPSFNWISQSGFQSSIGKGIRLPNWKNNDDILVESFAAEGLETGVATQGDHVVIERLVTLNCDVGVHVTANTQTHSLKIGLWSFENVNGGLRSDGSSSTGIQCDITMDGENSSITYDVNDSSGALTGIIRWNDVFRSPAVPTVTGAANVKILNDAGGTRAVQGAPAYTLGTAFQNPWWNPVWVQLSGGTVTNVQIGPTSAACTTSIATATPVTFRLPSGWWLNITGTVKPTTFNAVPD